MKTGMEIAFTSPFTRTNTLQELSVPREAQTLEMSLLTRKSMPHEARRVDNIERRMVNNFI